MQTEKDLNALKWLLDSDNSCIKYLASRDLRTTTAEELKVLREKAHAEGPIAVILSHMEKEGYWASPGAGYNPKYTSTVWSIILLSQLGAFIEADSRLKTACTYLLEHGFTKDGHFTINGLPSGTVDCLQGNLCAAMLDLGCRDSRLDKAFEWMARSVTGEGIAPLSEKKAPVRFYAGKCGPNFACGANNKLSCAWGAAKVTLAFSRLPRERKTPLIDRAIRAGVDFLFSTDPAKADYPCGYASRPSGNWWKFGFPVFYITDLLQIVEALVGLGYGSDSKLSNAIKVIRDKQDSDGRWLLEYDYAGKIWIDFGPKNKPNQWVTIRALRVLKQI